LLRNPFTLSTQEIRNRLVLPYIPVGGTHVDIGCGFDKYLLRKSPASVKIGFDKISGQEITDSIPLGNESVDCVTIVASLEHFENPALIIKESHRILHHNGICIITTPKAKGLWIMKIYDPYFERREGRHTHHFTYDSMCGLLKDYFTVEVYKSFECGFNQLFVCRKYKK